MIRTGLFAAHRRVWLLSITLATFVLPLNPATAQRVSAEAFKALDDEVSLLKETIETSYNQLRKLRMRMGLLEKGSLQYSDAVQDMQRRLLEINTLRKQLSELEAKVLSKAATKDDVNKKVRFHANLRIRPQLSINRTDLNADLNDDDAYWAHRVRLGLSTGMDSWIRGKIVAQEHRRFGQVRDERGDMGLHEAWVEIQPEGAPGFWLRAGRMEWSFGAERLIGRDDFSASGQAFDGAIIHWEHDERIQLDAFYAKIRESTTTDGDTDLVGLYATSRALKNTTIELYFMGLFNEETLLSDTGESMEEMKFSDHIYIAGGRAEALFFESLRLEAEAVFQFGSRTNPNNPEDELSHFATAYFGELSYQMPVATRPTIGAFFAWASGDANPADGKSLDFQTLFPTRHGFLGTMDLFSWSNLIDVGGTLELTPPGNFGVFTAFHYFMLAQPRGQLFGLGGAGVPDREVGRTVGMEIDAAVSWSPTPSFQAQLGYSVFLPGDVPKELGLGSDMAHWGYAQMRYQY